MEAELDCTACHVRLAFRAQVNHWQCVAHIVPVDSELPSRKSREFAWEIARTEDLIRLGAGVDRIVQRSMIGHTTEAMTERYSGVRLEDKRAAVLRIVQTETKS